MTKLYYCDAYATLLTTYHIVFQELYETYQRETFHEKWMYITYQFCYIFIYFIRVSVTSKVIRRNLDKALMVHSKFALWLLAIYFPKKQLFWQLKILDNVTRKKVRFKIESMQIEYEDEEVNLSITEIMCLNDLDLFTLRMLSTNWKQRTKETSKFFDYCFSFCYWLREKLMFLWVNWWNTWLSSKWVSVRCREANRKREQVDVKRKSIAGRGIADTSRW